jgi:hypothetical protein
LDRSVTLSADPLRRTERALAAAEASLNAGAFDSALRLLTIAEGARLDDLQRGRVALLQAYAAHALRRGSDAPPLLLQAAKILEPLDSKLARETYLDAWSAALFAGRLASEGNLYDVSRAARAGSPAPKPASPPDLLLDGFALLMTEGRSAGTPLLQRAAISFAGEQAAAHDVLRWGWLATVGAVVVWDYDSCLAIASRGVQLARDLGALTVLLVALNIMAQAVAMGGEFSRAAQLISEAAIVTEATGTPVLPYGALYLGAFEGSEEEVWALSERTIREAKAGGQGSALEFAYLGSRGRAQRPGPAPRSAGARPGGKRLDPRTRGGRVGPHRAC